MGHILYNRLGSGGSVVEAAMALADRTHTGPNLWIDNRPAFLRWTVFMSVNIDKHILRQSYHEREAKA